jgi:hypothetical protein
MQNVRVRMDTRAIERLSKQAQRQIPFATALALTKTAHKVREQMPDDMRRSLDRPRAFTAGKGAFFVLKATKRDLTATVSFKDIQARYMKYQIAGGQRRQTAYEKYLQGLGALPTGWVTIPGPAMPIDSFGNMKRGALSQLLASLGRGIGTYSKQGRGKKAGAVLNQYFVVKPGTSDSRTRLLSPGIYKRVGIGRASTIKPWIFFVQAAKYESGKFDFQKAARSVVAKQFQKEFDAAISRAMATARR